MGEFSWGETHTSRAPGSHLLAGRQHNPTTVSHRRSPLTSTPRCERCLFAAADCCWQFWWGPVQYSGQSHISSQAEDQLGRQLQTDEAQRHDDGWVADIVSRCMTGPALSYPLSVKYQLQDAVILFPVYHLLPTSPSQASQIKSFLPKYKLRNYTTIST